MHAGTIRDLRKTLDEYESLKVMWDALPADAKLIAQQALQEHAKAQK